MPDLLAVAAVIIILIGAALGLIALVTYLLSRPSQVGDVKISGLHDSTTTDSAGAVRTVQSAELELATPALDQIWTPMHLERLARTYWHFLSRCTLGLIRVKYTQEKRLVVLIGRPLVLLSFDRPQYEMDDGRGIVRWRIERGLLVAAPGIDADGYLEIDVARKPIGDGTRSTLEVDVEVANYYPRIAASVAHWAYAATQSRIHVLISYGFLRSIARGDLAPSKAGRFAAIDELPAPSGPRPSERGAPAA